MATKNPRRPPRNSVFDISTSDGGDFPRIIEIALFRLGSLSSIPIQILYSYFSQGCTISTKLYCIFIFDCKSTYSGNHVIKFTVDTTVTGLITDNDEDNYRKEIDTIVDFCSSNNLSINVNS